MLEELMRKWHPVSIGDAVLNIFRYRYRSTLTACKNCPPFLRLTYATKTYVTHKTVILANVFPFYIPSKTTVVIFYTVSKINKKDGKSITLDIYQVTQYNRMAFVR